MVAIKEQTKNEAIPNGDILLINEFGKKLGIFQTAGALRMAKGKNMDLVLVSPKTAKPMVAKIMDFNKHKFEQQKKAKEAKKNQKKVELKELRIGPTIAENDLNTKLKAARKFLAKGDTVKFSMKFRGRMIVHKNIGREVLNKVIEQLKDVAELDGRIKFMERNYFMILKPIKE